MAGDSSNEFLRQALWINLSLLLHTTLSSNERCADFIVIVIIDEVDRTALGLSVPLNIDVDPESEELLYF